MPDYKMLTFSGINTSLQVDDLIFYLPNQTIALNFSHSNSVQVFLGKCVLILPLLNQILVELDPAAINTSVIGPDPPYLYMNNGDFVMFAKDTTVNTSSLKGYYLSLFFENNSTVKAEMFQVSAETSASSQ